MQSPPRIIFRGLAPSEGLIEAIERRVEALENVFDGITGCHVLVDLPEHRHRKGHVYHVTVEVSVPRDRIAVSREPEVNHAHEDPYVAVRDAFDAMQRRLQDYSQRRRREVKVHDEPLARGRISRLALQDGFGFIETADGREVYFHENSVLDGKFDDLVVGLPVRFCEEPGENGPQASTVHARLRHARRLRGRRGEGEAFGDRPIL